MHLCDISGITIRKHLPINAAAADDKAVFCLFRLCNSFFRTMANGKAGNFGNTSGQCHIYAARQRLGENARNFVSLYHNNELITNKLVDFYRSLL